jgi:hypothetical protein
MSDADLSNRLRSKERYIACKLPELFQVLVTQADGSQELAFSNLIALLDSGLRLYAAEPGYVGDNDTIHKGDIKPAIIKAKNAGSINIESASVPVQVAVEGGTTWDQEQPLCALWIRRIDLEQACSSIGKSDLPWPDDELSHYWEIQARIEELQRERDRIRQMHARDIGEERSKTSMLRELNFQIEMLNKGEDAQHMGATYSEQQSLATTIETTSKPREKPPQAAQRDDALARLGRRTYQALRAEGQVPTCRRVIESLVLYDEDGEFKNIIEEIDYKNRRIMWIDDRGREQTTTFAGFQKRMTRIRRTTFTR